MEQFTHWAAETKDACWSLITANPALFIVSAFLVGFLVGVLVAWMLLRRRIRVSRSTARYYRDLFNRGAAQQLNEMVTRSQADPGEMRKTQNAPANIVGLRTTTEVFRGQPLSPEDLEHIRRELESFDSIKVVDEELRGLVKRHWPHLLAKLPAG